MTKFLHIFLVFFSFFSFFSRVLIAEFNAGLLNKKWIKISPHIIDTLLLVSGIFLIFQGQWLTRDNHWIIAKFLILILYIIFGALTLHKQGTSRWLAFTGAVFCYASILIIAISKKSLAFF